MTAAAVHVQMHKGNSAPVDIGCGSAINIRALLEPQVAMFEVGFYATGIYTLAQVGKDSSFWKLACLVTKHVQALYKSGEVCAITQAIGLLGLRTEVPAVPQRPTGSAFLGTVGVTDGAAPPGFPVRYGPFVLERGHCAVSMNLLEAVPILAVVTLDGRMQLNLTVSSSIDGALAQTLLTQFRSIILSECGITA
jgi:hypothetical protein